MSLSPSIDSTTPQSPSSPSSSSFSKHRISAPLPTLSSTSGAPVPSSSISSLSASRPISTPLPNPHQHPEFQKRSSSFYYTPPKPDLEAHPLPHTKDGPPLASSPSKSKASSVTSASSFLIYKYKPYFIPIVSVLQGILLVISFIVNWTNTGSPIETNPFSWMLGASSEVLVQMGALYPPCMRPSTVLIPMNASSLVLCSIRTPFPNAKIDGKFNCSYEDLCGPLSGGRHVPNQEFRVLVAVFLHAGLLHFLLNILAQWITLKPVEKVWGPLRMALVYLISGTYGFFLSGAFHTDNAQSTGASGAIFGCIGCFLIDMLVYWKYLERPGWQFAKFVAVMLVSFALGLIPYFDNFAHIGGFTMGTLVAMVVMPLLASETEGWASVQQRSVSARVVPGLVVRMIGLTFTLVLYILTVNAFYAPGSAKALCPWCRYLNCLPFFSQCQ